MVRGTTPAHLPVLTDRVVDLLAPALTTVPPGGNADATAPVLLDATVGLGGHSAAVLERCPTGRLVGVDRDPQALAVARDRLRDHADRVELVHAVYDELADVLERLGVGRVRGVLFDLGVSSLQLDQAGRGFAYSQDAPLDMRMDPTTGQTAAELLNTAPVEELTRILRDYGEERHAGRIARAVDRERTREPFTTSARLVEVVRDAIPAAARLRSGHPAKRTFQALRIAVNDELGALERALPAALGRLSLGGRIVVLAYHSLEDRLVKATFTALSQADVPPGLPVVPEGHEPVLRLLTRGAERPGDAEVRSNPRAKQARLRAAERMRE